MAKGSAGGRKNGRVRVLISGRVQGGWCRGTAAETARSLRLSGHVRNLPDGRVEAVFEGEISAITQAVQWCHHGPSHARVDSVDVTWEKPTGESGFRIAF